jgi:hypothetical protein
MSSPHTYVESGGTGVLCSCGVRFCFAQEAVFKEHLKAIFVAVDVSSDPPADSSGTQDFVPGSAQDHCPHCGFDLTLQPGLDASRSSARNYQDSPALTEGIDRLKSSVA